jgi:hemoglobin-like flavoprotein
VVGWCSGSNSDVLHRLRLQSLFEACPQVKVLFGFPVDVDPRSDELLKSKRFALHASFLMEMMEKTVQMLGDDNETLTKNLTDLGQKHVSFGVTPQYFPYMTDALIVMLKEMLGSGFTDDDKQAFENVMAVLIADMVRGQRTIDKGLAAAKKFVVVESWKKLTKVPNYQEKGGILLFQK